MLSNTCKYGIRAIIFIAMKQVKNEKVGLKLICDELMIPQPYLAKILQTLSKKKILDSTKGPHGGFSLIKSPAKLTLMDIILAIDEDYYIESCFITGDKCSFEGKSKSHCLLHDDLKKERMRLTKYFSNRTIESMIKQARRTPALKI
jgi:Rrf2 family protein